MTKDFFDWVGSKNQLPKPRPMSPYDVGVEMANDEFTEDMQPYLDNVARLGYDPNRARLMKGGYNISGLYYPENGEPGTQALSDPSMDVLKSENKPFMRGNVYVANDSINDGSIYAHEFRHRGYDFVRQHISKMEDEEIDKLTNTISDKFPGMFGIKRYSKKQIKDAIKNIRDMRGSEYKPSEAWTAYMDLKGKALEMAQYPDMEDVPKAIQDLVKKVEAHKKTPEYENRTVIEPVVASHIAKMLYEKRNFKEK